jgi:hypothetical protein
LYYLFYSHSGGDTDSYYATSSDGTNFVYQGYAIKRNSNRYAWDGGYIEIHTLFKYNDTHWIIYYGGQPTAGVWSIGCAFSTDLINWTKYPRNPIVIADPTSADPNVIKTSQGKYLMYYASYDSRDTWQILLANSSDGLFWWRRGVVLTYDPSSSWYSYYVAPTGVFEMDNKIYLMVVGKSAETQKVQNGLFMSDLKGRSFNVSDTNPYPCLPVVPESWESQIIAHSDFEIINGVIYIYYEGFDGANWQLGKAKIDNLVVSETSSPIITITICFAVLLIVILVKKKKFWVEKNEKIRVSFLIQN